MSARVVAAFTALSLALTCAAAEAQRARVRSAQLELDFTAWERGVGMVHTTRQSVRFELEIRGTHATLRVTGTSTGSHTELSPAGPGRVQEFTSTIDEQYTGTLTRQGAALNLALARAGATATLRWRCAPDAALDARFPDALRCEPSDAPDRFPWLNGGWDRVPVVLAPVAVANDMTYDGEAAPFVELRPAP